MTPYYFLNRGEMWPGKMLLSQSSVSSIFKEGGFYYSYSYWFEKSIHICCFPSIFHKILIFPGILPISMFFRNANSKLLGIKLITYLSQSLDHVSLRQNLFFFFPYTAAAAAAAAAKSLQSCLTLCDPTDGSRTGSPVPGILQARTLEWVAISFSNA